MWPCTPAARKKGRYAAGSDVENASSRVVGASPGFASRPVGKCPNEWEVFGRACCRESRELLARQVKASCRLGPETGHSTSNLGGHRTDQNGHTQLNLRNRVIAVIDDPRITQAAVETLEGILNVSTF